MNTPNSDLNEYRAAISALKQLLKERKITYKELSEGIGLTESGIKKIFAARDGSFQRLIQICKFIGVSLVEIIEDGKIKSVSYSKEQQEAFTKEIELFYLYWCLVYERQNIEEAKSKLQLNDKKAFQYLRKLDQLKLIKLLPKDRIRTPSIKAIRWKREGEFAKKMFKTWSLNLVNEIANTKESEDQQFILRYLQMKKTTYQEFQTALNSLEEEFVRRAIHEMRTSPNQLQHVRWLTATDNKSFINQSQT